MSTTHLITPENITSRFTWTTEMEGAGHSAGRYRVMCTTTYTFGTYVYMLVRERDGTIWYVTGSWSTQVLEPWRYGDTFDEA